MTMRKILVGFAVAGLVGIGGIAPASAWVQTSGPVAIGINDDGSLDVSGSQAAALAAPDGGAPIILTNEADNGATGLFLMSPASGATRLGDALSPGCYCEAWGVAGNGISGFTGPVVGTSNLTILPTGGGTGFFTTNASLDGTDLLIQQDFSVAATSADGAVFMAHVTLTNTGAGTLTDVRFARAMDWDVPPDEFDEMITVIGTGTTSTLLHSTDDGFANADPIGDTGNGGRSAPTNADYVDNGSDDHGSLFIFGFGDLAAGASYEFDIFYGAAYSTTEARSLLGPLDVELISIGQASSAFGEGDPSWFFAFKGVGGSIVIPNPNVPEPASLALFGLGLAGLGLMRRRRAA